MPRLEGWGFLCLMGCLVAVCISMTLLSGGWQLAGCAFATVVGILSGGLYAASVRPCNKAVPNAKDVK